MDTELRNIYFKMQKTEFFNCTTVHLNYFFSMKLQRFILFFYQVYSLFFTYTF